MQKGIKYSLILAALTLTIACKETKEEKKETAWLGTFTKPDQNPILKPDSTYTFKDPLTDSIVHWQQADVFNPAAIVKNDTVFMLFRAEDNPDAILGRRTSRIGLAYSTNGMDFTRYPEPVVYPDSSATLKWEYPGGIEDPRVVERPDGTYVMLHTSWDNETARLSAASSKDLKNWTKHGPVFQKAHDSKYLNEWSKSGSVVTKMENGRLIAAKINGKYWMYWGEKFVNAAWSDDLIEWTPTLDENGELLKSMVTRDKKFDSDLVEPGPPALLTEDGIILMYNGRNSENDELTDPEHGKGGYCGGQALFDAQDPTKFIERMDAPFICPSLPHETSGQYASGTTFVEALVYFKDQWFLYYGTADSMVGVAVSEKKTK